MTTVEDSYSGPLNIGRVIQQTFAIIGRRPVVILGLAFVLAGIPSAAHLYLTEHALSRGLVLLSGGYWFGTLVSMFISAFLEAALLLVAFGEIAGRPIGVNAALASALKFFLPLFAVNFLSVLGIIAGCILLVVPGIILAVLWCVAGPTLVVERCSITEVFGRSVRLTHGHRWSIFGLFVIYVVAFAILESAAMPFPAMWGGGLADIIFSPARAIGGAIISALAAGVGGVGVAVLYTELRRLNGGWSTDQLSGLA